MELAASLQVRDRQGGIDKEMVDLNTRATPAGCRMQNCASCCYGSMTQLASRSIRLMRDGCQDMRSAEVFYNVEAGVVCAAGDTEPG